MESLYLPHMTLNDPLDYAFEMMYRTDSRAIILNTVDAYKIYTNDDVAEMLTAPGGTGGAGRTCSILTNMRGIEVIELNAPLDALNQLLREDPLFRGQTILEAFFLSQFDQTIVDYGIIFPGFHKGFANLMMVITRHEGKAADIYNRRKVCVCNGTRRHRAYDRNTGDPCDVDPPNQYRCT